MEILKFQEMEEKLKFSHYRSFDPIKTKFEISTENEHVIITSCNFIQSFNRVKIKNYNINH